MSPAARGAALGGVGAALVTLGLWAAPAAAASPAVSPPAVGTREGMRAPGVVLADLEGGTVDLVALRGRVVVLNFWATWCGPCIAEMPDLDRLWGAVRGDGILVYAVNLDVPDREGLKRFVGGRRIRVPILLDLRGLARRVKRHPHGTTPAPRSWDHRPRAGG